MPIMAATVLALALAASTTSTVHAAGTQVVQIALQDSSSSPGTARMEMQANPTTVKAGRVTFEAVNQSRDLVHEVLVVPAPAGGKALPYDAKSNEIDESHAHSRGEIPELKPGAHGRLTLSLHRGTYLLVCNQPGHYQAGMFTKLTVE